MKLLKKIAVLVLTVVMTYTNVFAESQIKKLTVEEAVEKAIIHSRELISMDESLSEMKEEIEDTRIDMELKPDSYLNLELQLKKLENELANYDFNSSIQKKKIELSVFEIFVSVIEAENDLALYNESLKLSKNDLNIAEMKNKLGILSDSDFLSQKCSYEKEVLQKDIKQTAIDEAFIALNKLMGEELLEEYSLVLNVAYKPIEETDLELKYLAELSNNISLKEKSESLDISKYEYSKYSFDTKDYSTILSKEVSILDDEHEIEYEKKELKEKLTSYYNKIIQLENSYEANLMDLASMKTELATKQLQLYSGNVTEGEVEKYEYEIKKLENTIQSQVYEHEIMLMKFEDSNLL